MEAGTLSTISAVAFALTAVAAVVMARLWWFGAALIALAILVLASNVAVVVVFSLLAVVLCGLQLRQFHRLNLAPPVAEDSERDGQL